MRSLELGRVILLAVIAVFVIYAGYNVSGRVREKKEQLEKAKIEEKKEQEQAQSQGRKSPSSNLPSFKGVTFTEYDEGGRSFTLSADSFEIRNKKVRFFRTAMFKEAVMENVKLDFYQDNQWASSIQGQQAVMDVARMAALFTGAVTIRARGDKSLESESLSWSRQTGAIRVDGSFVYREGKKTIQGTGLYTDNNLSTLNFLQPADNLQSVN